MVDLKPCPFCGDAPRHLEAKAGFYTERVICDRCEFHLPPELWQQRAVASGVTASGGETFSRQTPMVDGERGNG